MLAQIFKFGCISLYHVHIFDKKNELELLKLLMQSLMLNRLAPVSNPENEKPKSLYAFF